MKVVLVASQPRAHDPCGSVEGVCQTPDGVAVVLSQTQVVVVCHGRIPEKGVVRS